MAAPVQIQIGNFGKLHHDSLNYRLVDVFESGEGVGMREIELPAGDFHLISGDITIYVWDEEKEEGTWYGSEAIRRTFEAGEVQVRTLPSQTPGERPEGQMHGPCPHDDHPEGCRARAIQAGFGCVVGQGRG